LYLLNKFNFCPTKCFIIVAEKVNPTSKDGNIDV
jgi:hypothetical protein